MGLREAQVEVAGMIRSGIAFDAIEDEIEEILDLDDQQRAASVAVRMVVTGPQMAATRALTS